ncbi:hypothetical protein FRC11_000547 [Ceratobasidium sp. 423]|nr:hypothetical protein FRC11_000547 [Ceratobasidium sp. 423]
MLGELHRASEQLCVALERYLCVCSSIQSAWLQGGTSRHIPPESAQQVNRELVLAESYDAKMQKAKLAIKITRNYAFSIVPINSLPPEILTRIFRIASNGDPSCIDHLAAVCSRWRSVSLGTCSLWTRIDYRPNILNWRFRELLARAELHVSRSGQLPLDVHISAASELYAKHAYGTALGDFCRKIAPYTQSLELDFEDFHTQWSNDSMHSVFTAFLSGCKPGILTKLVTNDADRFGFFTTGAERNLVDSSLGVDIWHSELEEIFAPIRVLNLTGLFPRWTSQAYCGLVELRLYPAYSSQSEYDNPGTIPESQLVTILSASPGLRLLHFDLHITDRVGDDGLAPRRACLTELEVLEADPGYEDNSFDVIESLLRLLEPGPKPLYLTIFNHGSWDITEPSPAETRAFFTRSNVTKFYATHIPRFLELLPSLPHLKVLILSEQTHQLPSPPPTPSDQPSSDRQVAYPRLDMCYLLNCELQLDELLLLVRGCRPRILILYHNRFHRDDSQERVDMATIEKELSDICPDIRVTDTYPNLEEHRELLCGY